MGVFPFFVLPLIAANNAAINASRLSSGGRDRSRTVNTQSGVPNKIGEQYRESIIIHAIREAGPSLFGWFSICPVNNAAKALGVDPYSKDAYNVLSAYHCINRGHIPKEIRKRIPELIRDSLN